MEAARQQLALYAIDPEKAEPFWRTLDSVYLQSHSADEIAWHARNLYFRVETPREEPIVRTRLVGDGEALQILVYVRDQPRVFVRVTGALGELGFSILDAKIHTSKDGYALDTFTVNHSEHVHTAYRNVRQQIEYALTETLKQSDIKHAIHGGRVNRMLKHVPFAPLVSIVPDERGQQHLLEIIAADRPGLLYRIANVLSVHDVNVRSARVNTLGLRAEDAFLVAGRALDTEKDRVRVETDLIAALQ